MPGEASEHEGTWLQWPHDKTYGVGYQKEKNINHGNYDIVSMIVLEKGDIYEN